MIKLKEEVKYLLVGFIGSLVGVSIPFIYNSFGTNKYGSLAEWVSGTGTIIAIFFAYWQINEQNKEFQLSKKYSVQIAFNPQPHLDDTTNGGKVPGPDDYYIWAVNDGMAVGSFKFLGFCRKDKFNKIRKEDVVFDPKKDGLKKMMPHSTNDFELLRPGQVSKEHIVSSSLVKQRLNNPKTIYVIYMDALGKLYKREIYL